MIATLVKCEVASTFSAPRSCVIVDSTARRPSMHEPLTICTVSFNSGPFVELNVRLTKLLNAEGQARWIIAENSPAGSRYRVRPVEDDVRAIDGVEPGHTPHHHHALALRECIGDASTRFLLVIDPDFFVVRQDWIRAVVAHMESRGLGLFGVPWHPLHSNGYRYFPAVHFCMFDTERFPKHEIDFTPDYPDGANDPNWPNGWDPDRNYFARSAIARLLAKLPVSAIRHRRAFHTDTGSRMYKKFVDARSVRYEILEPVFDPDLWSGKSLFGAILDRVLPDELCYRPKRYNPPCRRGFLRSLLPDDAPSHWEEFTWAMEPFGFHVRLNNDRQRRNIEVEANAARWAIDCLLGHRPAERAVLPATGN
jgi:hypothetical protein